MNTKSRPDPEMKAIMKSVTRSTARDFTLLALICFGLYAGAQQISKGIANRLGNAAQEPSSVALTIVFWSALAFVIWSFSKKQRAWTDGLKNVMSFERFLKLDPANTVLAPNLDVDERTTLLKNLQAIASREDVCKIVVGLLPEEGNFSDQVLIKTYATKQVISEWPALLGTGFQHVSTYRYEVNGMKRSVQSLLFVWD